MASYAHLRNGGLNCWGGAIDSPLNLLPQEDGGSPTPRTVSLDNNPGLRSSRSIWGAYY